MEKANWNAEYTRILCEICKEETEANNRPLGCLDRKGYKNLEEKFFKQYGQKLVKKQLKNKWDLLKKEYTEFMVLKNGASGLGWNDAMSTIVADDDWWNNHLQKYPKHAKWKTRGPANLKEMDVMFDKTHVTGATASIPGELSGSDEDEDEDV
ncbi:L10-interacting MYB domain-containing protein [Brachypodium distachyon]|uniref:L10-interacting MYB domain-containing protein n=1 Tax=Brachypodium distachyon TaxID=15368 RepID=UPI00052FE301|nr:L10-interacting MYB domain-containing protein [Brachypodium distachyon]|eukprot:XP_010233557.1 L10-interacting MYB domain-containing protein [Brachypodium distachyon]